MLGTSYGRLQVLTISAEQRPREAELSRSRVIVRYWSGPRHPLDLGRPRPTGARVEPKLVRLPAVGALVLSSGREGQYIWTVKESDLTPGREHEAKWAAWDVHAHHDATVLDPRYRFQGCGSGSTYYSSLTVLGALGTADSVLLSYDHLPESGSTCGRADSIFTVRLTFKAALLP